LTELRELTPEDVLGKDQPDPATDTRAMKDELKWIKDKREELADLVLKSRTVAEQVVKLDKREEELNEKLGTARERQASPPADSWKTVAKLTDMLDRARDA